MATPQPVQAKCYHCGLPIFSEQKYDGKVFCCSGCVSVFQILSYNGLENYYQIKQSSKNIKTPSPAFEKQENDYSYIEQESFLEKFFILEDGIYKGMFFSKDIHCSACAWLLNQLPQTVSGVEFLRVSIENSILEVHLKRDKGSFRALLSQAAKWGYHLEPILTNEEANKRKKEQKKLKLKKIAVAAVCTGNIMMFSVASYAGVSGDFQQLFLKLSALFFIPVLFYSSRDFFLNTFNSFKSKQFSIDIPIAIALIMGGFYGYKNVISGQDLHYFDTLSVLVFFILSSRYILDWARDKGQSQQELLSLLNSSIVQKKTETSWQPVHSSTLNPGDIILLKSNEILCCDATLQKGEGYIDKSILTGESLPIKVKVGEALLSGMKSYSSEFEVQVQKTPADSYFAQMTKSVIDQHSPFQGLLERYSKFLIFFSLISALAILFFSYPQDLQEGQFRALAVLIITCPCALGLISPLIIYNAIKTLAQKGIILFQTDALERIPHVKKIYFDKTGTLTYGKLSVGSWSGVKNQEVFNAVYSLEKFSIHPVATALSQYCLENDAVEIEVGSFQENLGQGVQGWVDEKFWEIKASNLQLAKEKEEISLTVSIYKNRERISTIELNDKLREESYSIVSKLKKRFQIKILSGDKKQNVYKVGSQIGITESDCYGEVSPESKAVIVSENYHALMIGDGINDLPAISKSFVGIATKGQMKNAIKHCDIYFLNEGIGSLDVLINVADDVNKQIKVNIGFALVYNLLGITLATMGHITPLFAAIFMPVTSLVLLTHYIYRNNLLEKKIRVLT